MAGAGLSAAFTPVLGRAVRPADKIRLGLIGTGSRGAGLATLILWAGRDGRHLRVLRWQLPIPGYRLALAQIAVAALDLAAASAALFVLVPDVTLAAWPTFFMGYTLAIIAVLITHVPGGIGIFEAVMVAALPGAARPELVAALIAYRLLYYVLPLLVAGLIVAAQEGRRWRRPVGRTLRGLHAVASGIAPTMVSALVFLGGVVLLVSGALPAVPNRIEPLYRSVPSRGQPGRRGAADPGPRPLPPTGRGLLAYASAAARRRRLLAAQGPRL